MQQANAGNGTLLTRKRRASACRCLLRRTAAPSTDIPPLLPGGLRSPSGRLPASPDQPHRCGEGGHHQRSPEFAPRQQPRNLIGISQIVKRFPAKFAGAAAAVAPAGGSAVTSPGVDGLARRLR